MKPIFAFLALLSFGTVQAALVNQEVPENAYITINGLDWAWAGACAPVNIPCGNIDLSYQSQFGWRLPTTAELNNHPDAIDFVFPGANVPLGGSDANGAYFFTFEGWDIQLSGDAACAAPYFSTQFYQCDWPDGERNYWAGLPYTEFYWETLVVRTSAVPIPAAVWLFASGLGLLGWMKRKQVC